MLKIRLMRIGARKRPFYRIVVVDERSKRNGAYVEQLGTYDPLVEPHEIILDKSKMEDWIKKGAQKSDGLLRMLKEAPQRNRKPKKEVVAKEEPKAAEEAPAVEEAPAEETPAEETPEAVVEEIKTEEKAEEVEK